MELNPNKFPIDQHLEDIRNELQEATSLLIKAETGAGKTTRLPPFLCQTSPGKILVLEPRRLAAKLSASRCAEILNSQTGDIVGHHIRHDKKASAQTKLLFITEGLFLPYLRQDPKLSDYSLIIIDEFHERSIHTDVAICLIRHLQKTTRPDLKLIVMSATLETDKLEEYLDSPKVFNISGRTFPITIEYPNLEVTDAIEDIIQQPQYPHNILVFLPGMGAIRKIETELKNRKIQEEIIPLHSTLSKKEQDKAFQGAKRKIILSTNIAETSLTIPNVSSVIDTGTERRASFAPWSGMPLLQLEKISKASATQRAGRAGRVQDGLVYRLYSQSDFGQREAFTPPEIKRVELSHYILDLIDLNLDPIEMDWFEAPEKKSLDSALSLLEMLGAIKRDHSSQMSQITEKGKFMANLPLHPRLGAMLFNHLSQDTLLAACTISESMALNKTAEFSSHDEEICDLSIQVDLLKSYFWKERDLSDYGVHYLDKKKASRILELYKNLASQLKLERTPAKSKTDPSSLTLPLLDGFPDRVAHKRAIKKNKGKAKSSYNFCLGRGGKLSFRSSLMATEPDYIIVLDALENPKVNAAIGTTIQAASKITKQELLMSDSSLLNSEKESLFNEKKGTLILTTHAKYGKLTLESQQSPSLITKGEVLIQVLKDNWPWPFENDDDLSLYNQRVKLLDKHAIDHQCPLFEAEMFELFLESIIDEETSLEDLQKAKLKSLIQDQLSPQDQYILDHETPEKIELENGKSFKVYYDEEKPYLMARIQDLYSVKTHPTICQGKMKLNLKLLSPAERVAQIVSDLQNFWQGSWESVKKELKARYPKHHWPDSPETSPPIRVKSKL